MEMRNIDSKIKLPKTLKVFTAARAGILSREFYNVPVYLVSPKLMDQIYPPSRRRFLNPDCAREILEMMDKREIPPEEISEKLERCIKETVSNFVAVGVYFPSVPAYVDEIIKEISGKDFTLGRAIFICPERIKDWVSKVKKEFPDFQEKWGFQFLFTKVHLHELAHAFMDGRYKLHTWWERLIEESLANALAYRALCPVMGDIEKAAFEMIVDGQPIEYQGWRYFILNSEKWLWDPPYFYTEIAKAWKRRATPDLMFFLLWGIPFLGLSRRGIERIFRILRFELPHLLDEIWDEISYELFRRPSNFSWVYLAVRILRNLL